MCSSSSPGVELCSTEGLLTNPLCWFDIEISGDAAVDVCEPLRCSHTERQLSLEASALARASHHYLGAQVSSCSRLEAKRQVSALLYNMCSASR
jgi:hypothetical protein